MNIGVFCPKAYQEDPIKEHTSANKGVQTDVIRGGTLTSRLTAQVKHPWEAICKTNFSTINEIAKVSFDKANDRIFG